MAGQDIWWSYWYFHLPNYVLSAVIYTMFGRFLLGFFVAPDSTNYIWRWFRRLTDPFIWAIAFITPRALPPVLLPPVAAFWLMVLRFFFFIALFEAGLTPRMAPAGGGG